MLRVPRLPPLILARGAATNKMPALIRIAVRAQETSQRYGYVHGFTRPPTRGLIPSKDSKGNATDVDEIIREYDGFLKQCSNTVLFDNIHEMEPLGTWESTFPADMVTHYAECVMPMPRQGQEHRTSEFNETLRYARMAGLTGSVTPILQADEKSRACAGDFVVLPMGLAVAKSSRTNEHAITLLRKNEIGEANQKYKHFSMWELSELPPEAPPLNDFLQFGGNQTLFVWDTPYGRRAAKDLVEQIPGRPWEVVRIEEGCHFLSFYGGYPKWDMIADEDFERSLQLMADASFNPMPIQWKVMRSLGISMRSLCLVLRFSRGGYAGGGFHSHDQRKKHRDQKVFSVKAAQKEFHGVIGAQYWSQWMTGELGTPVDQPPPRYARPMHRSGALVRRDRGGKFTGDEVARFRDPSKR